MENQIYKTHTSRSWDFLGLSKNDPKSLVNKGNQGDGIIIGIIDSGIGWADLSEAFNDRGVGPIPSRWKGSCKSESKFDATKYCNKKIIGARWYLKGMIDNLKQNMSMLEIQDSSPLDNAGHGTHVAYTAAGSYVNDVKYYGLNMGTTRGGAPLARLAVYKACWIVKDFGTICSNADVLAAIDDGIRDGVDILSASIGGGFLNTPDVSVDNMFGIGSFHAVSHGISVVVLGGNDGPDAYTVSNTSPWLLTVAASNSDREIVTPLTLGNNKTILAPGIFRGPGQPFAPLVAYSNVTEPRELGTLKEYFRGKVVMLFAQKHEGFITPYFQILKGFGAVSFIYVSQPTDQFLDYNEGSKNPKPIFIVDTEQGNLIYSYYDQCISSKQNPVIKIGQTKILEGEQTYLRVPKFSSRGPNSFAPEIMKLHSNIITAPGVNILAPYLPSKGDNGFELSSGTSMATPHIAGIVALLKVAHPNWSPAAFKSALVTTAWNDDTYPIEIFAVGGGVKLANAFDYGGGICNPNGAMDPGLIYDMNNNDYLNYLCSLGYDNTIISNVTKNSTLGSTVCPKEVPSRLDLNLPSIIIPNLKNSVTVKRTVTNVGVATSVYKLVVKPPRNVAIKVTPSVLTFNPEIKKITFDVEITSTYKRSSIFTFGSLGWSDDKHFVRIPVGVGKQIDDPHPAI